MGATVTEWNFADVWEAVADHLADAAALTHGERTVSWRELDRRADGLARWLLDQGVKRQDKVALYLTNCPEYLEATFAAFKISLVPINTNYRYADAELAYLWENADAVAVVFHGSFTERADRVRHLVPRVRSWLWVDDGSGPCPEWALPYEDAVATPTGERVRAPWGRGADDLLMLYTGGTTGMPKGVMWRQDDLFARLNASGFRRYDQDAGLSDVHAQLEGGESGMTLLPACPLMHGTGCFTALECLAEGGRVVTLASRQFDPVELLDTVEREQVNGVVIVGDAFAKPILAALDDHPGRWDLTSLVGMISSGVMWSEETKQGLLKHHPGMLLIDAFSSSEALGMGTSVSSGADASQTARFTLGPEVRVLDADGRDVVPGSGTVGVLALGGRIPLGYYKDEDKSASTFRVIDGARYSVPGDFAEVAEDGTIHLLGRGSACINTGGEKVYPEEVEEAVKTFDGIVDAVAVGIPNERFGEEIVAVVELAPGVPPDQVEPQAVIDHVKAQLASYKAPKRVRLVETIGRSPSGKVDYGRLRREATAWAGGE
ncbi:MAG: AMP-binding protein [Actinomycetota bacterium]|nr:AMP-binding protein [Actinomycetota bacterium]